MHSVDVLVIGGGILGCFTARALTRYQLTVGLVEKECDVCMGISRGNTAIVYSGYDTKPQSKKTELCVKSNDDFERLQQELDIRFKRIGSLMICFGEQGAKVLRQKYADGQQNKVPGLKLLNREQVLQLEPNLNPEVYLGLWSPTTGTVNPFELNIAAFENARANGCQMFLNQQVLAIKPADSGYLITTNKAVFHSRSVVNCAGLWADQIKEMVEPPDIRIFPDKADYYILDNKLSGYINHIIFHEQEGLGKGLTLVPTIDGNLLIGPSKNQDAAKDDYATSKEGLAFLNRCLAQVVPNLPLEQIIRNFGTLRPNPYYVAPDAAGNYQQLKDKKITGFRLSSNADNPGFFSFVGIKTPGMTCADGLGRYAADTVAAALHISAANPNYNPVRQAIPRVAQLEPAARQQLIAENPSYGRIVCRCRGISEGEIIAAIERGATTINGVKRRVGAGFGRCQGGYCMQRVMELIAQETGLPLAQVTLDGAGSAILQGGCHG